MPSKTTNTSSGNKKSVKRYIPTVARFLLGIMFLVFGLNGFLNFIPQPTTGIPKGAMDFSLALMGTGYMMQLIAAVEIIVGILLVANRFVPLALALLAPIVVNIVAFHVFLYPETIVPAIVVLALEVYLAWVYRKSYESMLAACATPE